MRERIVVILLVGIFLSVGLTTAENTKTLYVDDDGTADYTRIQDAIDNATDGDTVYVYNGAYHENVRIGKSITLTGEDKLYTIIDGRDVDDGITVTVDNVQISGFKITNSQVFNAGIWVYRADYTSISECIITENNGVGISLDATSHATISNCTITSNEQFGVVIYTYNGVRPSSNNNLVTDSIISDNEIGVFLDDTTGNSVIGNCISDNWEYGIRLAYAEGNKIKENDFIENNVNAYFRGPFRNYWNQNYWDRSFDMSVKIIVGSVFFMPWVNFDWGPSAEPNTIFNDKEKPHSAGIFNRISFDGKTGTCLLKHLNLQREGVFGIKWGFMAYSEAIIDIGSRHYVGDGIILLNHFRGTAEYNQTTEHWALEGFARFCFVINQ